MMDTSPSNKHSIPQLPDGYNVDIPDPPDREKVYLEAYITEAEPKVCIRWCSECDIPVVEGNMVVAVYSYQDEIDHCKRQGWGHASEIIEVSHEECLSGKRRLAS